MEKCLWIALHIPKIFIIQIDASSAWKNALDCPAYTENFYHTFWGIKCMEKCFLCKKKIKTNLCGCLIPINIEVFIFWKKAYHTILVYENCMTSIFLMATQNFSQVILKLPQNVFLVFYQPQIVEFSTQTKFCMQNLTVCVHNIVLDTLMLDFLKYFLLKNFFQNKHGMVMYALINVW